MAGTISATALRALTAEVARHPGPKTVLVGGATVAAARRVLDLLAPDDQLVLAAEAPDFAERLSTELGADWDDAAGRVSVVTSLADVKGSSVDVAVAAEPLARDAALIEDVLGAYRAVLAADGVLSVATPFTLNGDPQALAHLVSAHAVRSELVVRGRPPLRVHHLRFETAGTSLAERLLPVHSPSSVTVTPTMGIDSNGVAAAAILGGAAALVKAVRPRSKAWLVPAVLALPVAAFFRDPRRVPPLGDPGGVVAASDGVVLRVDRVEDKRFGPGEWLRIVVFLSVLDVHVNRSPVAGRVVDIIREDGGYAMAQSEAAEHNVAQYTVLETARGRVVVAQRTGLIARRIVNRARIGSVLARGERYGLIRFGSRTDVYLPAAAVEPAVAPGDRVTGAQTIIARYL
ncbi:MAG: phosphatidylserine decarboxylase [Cryptosporangiaceae bacterium]|nr:phosphatidylserine decarboxylase [Cryptosporangiaceae bacterium]